MDIKFASEEAPVWRCADLKPGECATLEDKLTVIIALAFSEVEFKCYDEYRETPGIDGVYRRKHFFFRVNDHAVIALPGDTPIYPARAEIIVRDGNPDMCTASNMDKYTTSQHKVDTVVMANGSEDSL